ncbi:hypothetical protein SSYIS1_06940 [Serratia symbiotica]|uniref:Uncharacterized protein n=1 Tax=Serratia symbiotica TaxID=138074 RepID=A0A455VER8_9GAMM|nr:hypothetical protein SSYIS1_06940 [Serratia symbiotica]
MWAVIYLFISFSCLCCGLVQYVVLKAPLGNGRLIRCGQSVTW